MTRLESYAVRNGPPEVVEGCMWGDCGHHEVLGFLLHPQDRKDVRTEILRPRHESAHPVILRTPRP